MMNELEAKVRCLELAQKMDSANHDPKGVAETAQVLYAFVSATPVVQMQYENVAIAHQVKVDKRGPGRPRKSD